MAKCKIEFDLKQQNKKADDDYVVLEEMEPSALKFTITDDLRNLLPNLIKVVNEYVQINNDYVNIKNIEEKIKVSFSTGQSHLSYLYRPRNKS